MASVKVKYKWRFDVERTSLDAHVEFAAAGRLFADALAALEAVDHAEAAAPDA